MCKIKKSLILASVLVLFGLLLFCFTACTVKGDLSQLGGGQYETATHNINEDFDSILMNTDTADIVILRATDGKSKVVCHEHSQLKHTVVVKDGVLTIEETDTRKWYHYINIGVEKTEITVYLADGEYSELNINENTGNIDVAYGLTFDSVSINLSTGDTEFEASVKNALTIKAGTGDVSVEEAGVGSLSIMVTTGDVEISEVNCAGDIFVKVSSGKTEIEDVVCKSFTTEGSTGDIVFENLIASAKLSITRGTGDVCFEACDAAEIEISTSTGDVVGTLLSEKIFVVSSGSGKIKVPETLSGGKCKITTSTGDVKITIK